MTFNPVHGHIKRTLFLWHTKLYHDTRTVIGLETGPRNILSGRRRLEHNEMAINKAHVKTRAVLDRTRSESAFIVYPKIGCSPQIGCWATLGMVSKRASLASLAAMSASFVDVPAAWLALWHGCRASADGCRHTVAA